MQYVSVVQSIPSILPSAAQSLSYASRGDTAWMVMVTFSKLVSGTSAGTLVSGVVEGQAAQLVVHVQGIGIPLLSG
jgi:hypothetical protein